MKKVIWIDTETTGVDPKKACPIQVACMIEIDGRIVESKVFAVAPDPSMEWSSAAEAVHGITEEQAKKGLPPAVFWEQFKAMMKHYVNPYNKKDKFFFGGYFCRFDLDMLKELAERCGDKYFFSWFYPVVLDVGTLVAFTAAATDRDFTKFNLSTVCEWLDVSLEDAHDAYGDILATHKVYQKLRQQLGVHYMNR